MLSTQLMTGHEFIGLNSFLFIFLILSCLLLGGLIKRYNFHYLPESGGSMLFGLLCGAILNMTASDDEQQVFAFSPNLFFFVILPPIILDAGYTLKRKDFFQNLGTITLLAVVGTVINTLVFGYLLFGFAKLGWIPLDSASPLECLLFGSIISSTDPVATLGLLGSKDVNAHPLLYSLVFGESVLNDAIAIVLFKTFEAALPEADDGSGNVEAVGFSNWDLVKALLTFIGVSSGSLVLGIGTALFCCFIFKRIDFTNMPVYEFTLVTLFAYISYFMAEMLYLSGIMSLFFCSVCLAHYNYYNISTNAQIATQEAFKSIAQICETFVFAYIGITAGLSIQSSHLAWSLRLIVLTIVSCLIARATNVFPICTVANLRRKGAQRIPFKMMVPLWFAGLRGAISFALSLSFVGPHAKYVVSSTLVLVLFTTLVGGGFTLPLLRRMGMTLPASTTAPSSHGPEYDGDGPTTQHAQLLSDDERDDHKEESEDGLDTTFTRERRGTVYTGWIGRFKHFDNTFMRKWFGGRGSPRGSAPGVLDAYGAPVPIPTNSPHEYAMHEVSEEERDSFVQVGTHPNARFVQSDDPEYTLTDEQESFNNRQPSIILPSTETNPSSARNASLYTPPIQSPSNQQANGRVEEL